MLIGATNFGGGSYCASAAEASSPVIAEFSGCSFTGNAAKVDGGAIAVLSGVVIIQVDAAHLHVYDCRQKKRKLSAGGTLPG